MSEASEVVSGESKGGESNDAVIGLLRSLVGVVPQDQANQLAAEGDFMPIDDLIVDEQYFWGNMGVIGRALTTGEARNNKSRDAVSELAAPYKDVMICLILLSNGMILVGSSPTIDRDARFRFAQCGAERARARRNAISRGMLDPEVRRAASRLSAQQL